MTGSEAGVEELLRVLSLGSWSILSRQVEHGSWAYALGRAQLLLTTVWSHLLLLHLLHSLQVLLLLLQIVLMARGGRLARLVVMIVFRVTAVAMATLARCTLHTRWLPCGGLLLVAVLATSTLLTLGVVLEDLVRGWMVTVLSLLRAVLRRMTTVQY